MTMFQPFLASSTALAAPMPDPEPVMIATLRVMDSCFLVSYGIVNGSPTAAQYGKATNSTTANATSVIHTPKRKISGAVR